MVAIDGPVAAGKTTVGQLVAEQLDGVAFDTGLLYRAVAWRVIRAGVDPSDREAVAEIARTTHLDLRRPSVDDGRSQDLVLDDHDVTWDLRSPEIDRALPEVSANPGVRQALLSEQRRIARSGRVVMIGRDIGTVIVPETPYKFYLDAPLRERARRRYEELRERGVDIDFDHVLKDLKARDDRDSSRKTSPLRPADDAVMIDTSSGSADEIAARIVDCVRARLATQECESGSGQ